MRRNSGRGSRDRGRGSRDSGRRGRGGRGGGGFNYQRRSTEDVQDRATKGDDSRESIFVDGDVKVFTPQTGDNCVRVLPPTWEGAKHYGLDIYVHYNVGPDGSAFLCPRSMKTDDFCPLCDERKKAQEDNDEDYARELNPSHRVLYYMIDRDEEKEGVKVWSAPYKAIDKEITAQTVDRRTGEILYIDDPDNGYDIEFVKEGKDLKTRYTGVRIARSDSDIGRNQDDILEQIQETPLTDMLNHATSEHIEEVFFNKKRSSNRSSEDSNSDASVYTYEEIQGLDEDDEDKIISIIDEFNLDIVPDDFPEGDGGWQEILDAVCEELGLETAKRSSGNKNRAKRALRDRR